MDEKLACNTFPNIVSEDVKDEIQLHLRTLKSNSKLKLGNSINKVALEIAALTNTSLSLDEASTSAVLAHLNAAKRLLRIKGFHKNLKLTSSSKREPANKLSSHQKRFFSLKTSVENHKLGNIQTQKEFTINNGELDHDYTAKTLSVSVVPKFHLNVQDTLFD